MLVRLVLALLALTASLPAAAQQKVAGSTSPGGVLSLDVTINGEGRIGYAVARSGKPVIGESQVGFLFADAPQMLRDFALVSQSTRDFDETWEQPWGEWRRVRNNYRELTLTFEEKLRLKRRMTI